ncbi:MAG: ATP-binding protein [Chlorobi bacterium]|nr:ATP-binding protein [Chlorobiota bacterium]
MILEFKIQNFLSFKDEVVFSFEATPDTTLEDYYVTEVAPGVRILKMAMVYGANASGKSNLLEAFNFIHDFIEEIPKEKGEETGFTPFKFDKTKDQIGSFELTFYIGDKKHRYILEIDEQKIYKETLFFYPGTQPAVIFDRHLDKENQISVIGFGPKIKISNTAKEQIQLKTLKNTSVFAAYSQVNIAITELEKVNQWFKNQFMSVIDPYTTLTKYTDSHIEKNSKLKDWTLKFIKEADINISNILFEEEVRIIPDELIEMFKNSSIPKEEKIRISKEKNIHIQTTVFEHTIKKGGKEELYKLPKWLQSKGTMRYYGLSAPFFNTIKNDGFLPIDEIGSALHPLLVMHFLKEFLKKSKQAQLLFTTHNLSLLMEKDILRKDAIWFTEKKEDGSTSLYSMADFNFRKELSFYNAYKQGKFGAIPEFEN